MYTIRTGISLDGLFNEKLHKMWKDEREAVRILREKVEPDAKYVWFHAASLGEFGQGRPLIEQVREDYPRYKILLTFFSSSGYEVRKNHEGADIITRLLINTVGNTRKFLRAVRPVVTSFIKYEFWYNYLHILQHHGVPVYNVSSIFRPNQIFSKWYGRGYGRVLKCLSRFFVQNEESRSLLSKIGITDVMVTGDIRFDRVLQVREASRRSPLAEKFANINTPDREKVLVADSSWQPDEEIFIKYFNERKDWKLVIAPHVIGEEHLKTILSLIKGKKVVRYTQANEENIADAGILITDCFDLLSSIYHYGDVACVGSDFRVGIHSVLEATVWGMPVLPGPNNKCFAETQRLLREDGGYEVFDLESFSLLMNHFAGDEEFRAECGSMASAYVVSLAGATNKVLNNVKL